MKNSQKGFIVPVLLAIIAVLVIGGGVYVYQNKKAEAPDVSLDINEQTTSQVDQNNTQTTSASTQNNSSIKAESNLDITLDQILNSNGFVNGVKHGTRDKRLGLPVETVLKDKISFGDIDGDGHVEAVVPVEWCDASCGRMIYVYKNDNSKILSAELKEAASTSAKQGISSIVIQNGKISITKSEWMESPAATNTYQVKFVNGKLQAF